MTEEYPIYSPRKLIEVALPLDAINVASAKEKSIRHGHPSTLHLWWARRPLATARAVIFAQMVNDPGYQQGGGFKYGKNKKEAAKERKRLFGIIEELVLWENTANEVVLEKARTEIRRSWKEVCDLNKDHPQATELFDPDKLPGLNDPFAGGGSIPLEAQRLGLEAHASDLNPVAVLINKAMIEIPPRFVDQAPVNPSARNDRAVDELDWPRVSGLAEDVRYYGQWIRNEAEKLIGHFYPPVEVTAEMVAERPDLETCRGKELPVIAWIWARTVRSPNPAFAHVDVPLASTFVLSSKKSKESYIQPIIEGDRYQLVVKSGPPPTGAGNGTKIGKATFACILSGAPIDAKYIRAEAVAGRMGSRLLAVVAKGHSGRVYLTPQAEMEATARSATPSWKPDLKVTSPCHDIDRLPMYGMNTFGDAFTSRQLLALTTLSDLIEEARIAIYSDATAAGRDQSNAGLSSGGAGAKAYAEAISVYLAFAIGKATDYNSSICTWISGGQTMRNTFGRQAIPMVWDYAEANPLGDATGSYISAISQGVRVLRDSIPANRQGTASQLDAQKQASGIARVISTDPPYYDNIGYADLSDFFYVWLRASLRGVFPQLLATISVPKEEELVAATHRHKTKKEAQLFFLTGMTEAMRCISTHSHPCSPITIYYAFKQSEVNTNNDTSSTGWDTFLEAVTQAGLAVTGTWPIRTEMANKVSGAGNNMLASSIVLVCRRRSVNAPAASRREFIRELNQALPEALDEMTRGIGDEQSPVAPVDLSQAIIGPGMAVFSKYSAVLEADGEPMSVRTALQLINRFLAEDDFDKDTQFCLHWFEQYGWDEGLFGEADVLARAKATAVDALDEAGVIESGGGTVKLLRWNEYPTDWDPTKDSHTPIWEALHHLIRGLKHGGESEAGQLLAGVLNQAEAARQLAYRLYTLCERKGWAEDAGAYNELITSWSGIESATPRVKQKKLF